MRPEEEHKSENIISNLLQSCWDTDISWQEKDHARCMRIHSSQLYKYTTLKKTYYFYYLLVVLSMSKHDNISVIWFHWNM